jgi:hypothetical protein
MLCRKRDGKEGHFSNYSWSDDFFELFIKKEGRMSDKQSLLYASLWHRLKVYFVTTVCWHMLITTCTQLLLQQLLHKPQPHKHNTVTK